jgi:hypothetical protein
MMKTLVVVLEHRHAFPFPGFVFWVRVCDVAGEDFLPEGEAAGGSWYWRVSIWVGMLWVLLSGFESWGWERTGGRAAGERKRLSWRAGGGAGILEYG